MSSPSRRHFLMLAAAAAGGLALPLGVSGVPGSRSGAPDQKVIGGEEAPKGAYPFLASLQRGGAHSCAGTLINSSTLLTAAHCTMGSGPTPGLKAVFGRHDLNSDEGREIDVVGAWVHPKYGAAGIDGGYDLAYLTLAEPVTDVLPVTLPTPGTDSLIRPGQKGLLLGWGDTVPGMPSPSNVLMQAEVPFLSKTECAIAWEEENRFNPDTDVCAGREALNACFGDSGGPLLRLRDGVVYQVGVVSRGGDICGRAGEPGVYTSLSSEVLWDTFTLPDTVVITSPNDGETVAPDVRFTGTGEPGLEITIETDQWSGTTRVGSDGTWTYTPDEPLDEGTYRVFITQQPLTQTFSVAFTVSPAERS